MTVPSSLVSGARLAPDDAPAGRLRRLGFAPHEIHYGRLLPDGRLAIPAVVEARAVPLLVDTAKWDDVVIDLGRARDWEWPYERIARYWGRSPLADFFALGRQREAGSVYVSGTEADADKRWSTYGELGSPFFAAGALALDPIDAAVAWSPTLDVASTTPAAALRVPLLPGVPCDVALTEALEDDYSSGERPRFMLATGHPRSVLSLEYVERAWRKPRLRRKARATHRAGRRGDVYLGVPGAAKRIWLEPSFYERTGSAYTAEEGGPRIDGYLGVDFLFQWLPVIDFARSTLWLTPLLDPQER